MDPGDASPPVINGTATGSKRKREAEEESPTDIPNQRARRSPSSSVRHASEDSEPAAFAAEHRESLSDSMETTGEMRASGGSERAPSQSRSGSSEGSSEGPSEGSSEGASPPPGIGDRLLRAVEHELGSSASSSRERVSMARASRTLTDMPQREYGVPRESNGLPRDRDAEQLEHREEMQRQMDERDEPTQRQIDEADAETTRRMLRDYEQELRRQVDERRERHGFDIFLYSMRKDC